MDLLTFLATMTGHAAWPLVAVFAIVLFRAEFKQVIRRIASFKKGDIEIGFEKDMKTIAVETAAEKVIVIEAEAKQPPLLPAPKATPEGWQATVLRISESSPVAAILLAWTVIEQEIVATAKRLGMPEDRVYRSPREITKWLEQHTTPSARLYGLVSRLSHVRNRLAHVPQDQIPAHELDVEIYLDGAETVITALSKLTKPN